jgi:AAA+ superfamily predicted ATPase
VGKIENWESVNQKYLMEAVREIKDQLVSALEYVRTGTENIKNNKPSSEQSHRSEENKSADQSNFPLEILVNRLHLSGFERSILLLCAGMELDTQVAEMISQLQNGQSKVFPSFSIALNVFSDGHWSAIAPTGPLRYWKLIENVESHSGQPITMSGLKIDENILFYLTGVYYSDERLGSVLHPTPMECDLVPSHLRIANRIADELNKMHDDLSPVIELHGDAKSDKTSIAAYCCGVEGLTLHILPVLSVPHSTNAINDWVRLWNRQAALLDCGLLLDCSKMDTADKMKIGEVTHFIEMIQGRIFIETDQWSPELRRPKKVLDIGKPSYDEQLMLWKKVLDTSDRHTEKSLEDLVSQFNLSVSAIRDMSTEMNSISVEHHSNGSGGLAPLEKKIWKQCCVYTRPKADELIQRIEPLACWEDIVLPEEQKATLMEMARQVKQRAKVYGRWGFASSSARGLGISALFTGESGTGKTMAAEVLANELKLDLYKVDLSQVVNKYIGETEKNLKRVFDEAEEGGAILLFDEADALFGKRSEVKDSHDRYGNIEVSYLLQRMESYRGLAILTTNMKSAMDKAFYRRIRFIVQFPFPDSTLRATIWKKVFPEGTPVKDLDFTKLSRLNIPGGNIRNIAMNAAFIAAHDGTAVSMSHLSRAARSEYNKLEKPLNTLETGGLY